MLISPHSTIQVHGPAVFVGRQTDGTFTFCPSKPNGLCKRSQNALVHRDFLISPYVTFNFVDTDAPL